MKQQNLLTIFILGSLTTISPFSIDMYLPAFQQIADALQTDVQKVALTLSSYFIGLAIGQICYGPFLDRFGRKPPLYFGLILYVCASISCLFSTNIESLILFRFIQALGGCSASVASVSMVRDFYGPKESAKVFSRLMLILSVSPMFAPTVGSWVVSLWGWQSVFVFLAIIVSTIFTAVFFLLPEGHQPDPTVKLNPKSIGKNFLLILQNKHFITYAVSGAFSFSGLFVYLAGSPSIFLGTYGISEKMFGLIFAFLSVGMVGGGQVNILLAKKFKAEKIFKTALTVQVLTAFIFAIGLFFGIWNLYSQIGVFFVFISCIGLTYPNAASLALMPFDKNTGTAASVLGFLQMGVGALSSAIFGLMTFEASVSISTVFIFTSLVGLTVLTLVGGGYKKTSPQH